jgi:hypothetical protein
VFIKLVADDADEFQTPYVAKNALDFVLDEVDNGTKSSGEYTNVSV